MARVNLRKHKFDSIIRLVLILSLIAAVVILEAIHSNLTRDLLMVTAGVIGGRTIDFPNRS